MANEDLQSYLVSLTGNYRVLKELQSRSEIQITELTNKSDKLNTLVLALNEHYKAYCQTMTDVLERLSGMFINIEKLKEQLHEVHIRLESTDGHKARCKDRFDDLIQQNKDIEDDVDEVTTKIEEVTGRLQELNHFIKIMATRLVTVEQSNKETQSVASTLATSYNDIKTSYRNLKWIGGVILALLTILSSLKSLGWM